MTHADLLRPRLPVTGTLARWSREVALGFVYWTVFVLVLEPGNVMPVLRRGGTPAWDQEAIRMLAAGLLGAAVTPAVLALVRRFPIEGVKRWRHGIVHLAGGAGLAVGLIVVSCLLAAVVLEGARRPLGAEMRDQLAVNGLLLGFAIAGLTAIGHAWRVSEAVEAPALEGFVRQLTVKSRGRVVVLELAEVDWIETQGNYLALHVGANLHLIRGTLAALEARLEPGRFVRIHRRTIVGVDRIRSVEPGASGDGAVVLADGQVLRLSRGFRASLTARLGRAAGAPITSAS